MDSSFARDVEEGLSASPKWLSSQYFYDDNGSRIFQQIMAMPEYYLTDCEFELLQTRSKDILRDLGFSGHFNVIELGPGDGAKTREMLTSFLQEKADITYVPVDISAEAISLLIDRMTRNLPSLSVNPQVGDYFEVLDKIRSPGKLPQFDPLSGLQHWQLY